MSRKNDSRRSEIGLGLMGLGVVGGGVAQVISNKSTALAARVGLPLKLRRVLVQNLEKRRPFNLPPELLTITPDDLLGDPDIDIIIEAMGGESAAHQIIQEAIKKGKHLVTANKVVMGKHGSDLARLAQEHDVALLYEASVGGGIPLISTLSGDLSSDDIYAVRAIINGTTNYILTRMAQDGISFGQAQVQAQELGYAEPDPTEDVEGIDAAHKLAIIASLAFHTKVRSEDVYREGISRLTSDDFQYASELGYAIKLLAIAKDMNGSVQARVHPVLIPKDLMLAKVDGVFNAIQIDADVAGRVLLYGRGAGSMPTASAIISDVVRISKGIASGSLDCSSGTPNRVKHVLPVDEIETQHYIRITAVDTYGVLAQITRIFGDLQISLESMIQKRTDPETQTAELVFMTHPARERAMRQAVSETGDLKVVKEIGNWIRVEA